MRKRVIFWVAAIAAWAPFAALFLIGAGFLLPGAAALGGAAGVLACIALCAGAVALSGAWLVVARRLAFAAAMLRPGASLPQPAPAEGARVLLVWDTAGGFDATALALSRRQNYPLLRTVIVDDGTDAARRRAVQSFAIRHNNVEVFAAMPGGAGLNTLLLGRSDYDFCVFGGEDLLLPADFVRRALDYFAEGACGGVQGRIAEVGTGLIARVSASASAVAAAERAVCERYGEDTLCAAGGVMFSRACIEGSGGFPYVPAPLPSFAADVCGAGFAIRFAPDIAVLRAPRTLPARRAENARLAASAREYARTCARTETRFPRGGAQRADAFFTALDRAVWPLTLLASLCAAALASANYFVWQGVLLVLLTGLLLYAASAAEAFAADRADPPAALLYALARFALDFGGPLAVPRTPSLQSAAVRAGISIAAGIALLLLAGFVCGNAWPLFCTALGCFLSPAAVCLPLARYAVPQGGEEE